MQLLAFGERVLARCAPGRGAAHYALIARQLATLQPAASGARSELGACARHLHGAATVFVVSDFLADDEMRRDLAAIAQHCSALHLLQVAAAAETRLRATGDFDLVDVETGARLQVSSSDHANTLAGGERAAMTARLRAFCARSGFAFTDWDLVRPWQHTLIAHLVQARSHC